MRSLLAVLTAAIGLIGCDGATQEIETFRLGPDGRPDMSTRKTEEVFVSQRSLLSGGYAYTWNCYGDWYLYGGEAKGYSGTNYSGYCRGWGAGGNNVMSVSMPEFNWPGTSVPINDLFSHWSKVFDSIGGTHHSRHCFYQNNAGGGGAATRLPGGSLACYDPVSPGGEVAAGTITSTTQSFDMARFCTSSMTVSGCS